MVPEDQDKTLDAKDLEEEHTRILKAQDPNVGRDLLGNIERAVYNYQEHAFKRTPLISQTAVHHVMTGSVERTPSASARKLAWTAAESVGQGLCVCVGGVGGVALTGVPRALLQQLNARRQRGGQEPECCRGTD